MILFLLLILPFVIAEDQTRWETLLTGVPKNEVVATQVAERSSYNNNYGLVNRNLPINGQVYEIKNRVHRLGLLLLRGTRDEVKDAIETAKQLLAKAKEIRRDVNDVVRESKMRTSPSEEREAIAGTILALTLFSFYPIVPETVTILQRQTTAIRLQRQTVYAIEQITNTEIRKESITKINTFIGEDLNPTIAAVTDRTYLYDSDWELGFTELVSRYLEATSFNFIIKRLNDLLVLPRESGILKALERIDSNSVEATGMVKQMTDHYAHIKYCWDLMQRARRQRLENGKADVAPIQTVIDNANVRIENIAIAGEPSEMRWFPLIQRIAIEDNLFMYAMNDILKNDFSSITSRLQTFILPVDPTDDGVKDLIGVLVLMHNLEEQAIHINLTIGSGVQATAGDIDGLQVAIDAMFSVADKIQPVIKFRPQNIPKINDLDIMIVVINHFSGYLERLVEELSLGVTYRTDYKLVVSAKADDSVSRIRSNPLKSFIEKWL